MTPGPSNHLLDVGGLTVGHASDHALASGVTAVLCEPSATAAVHVMGGAPGTRETDLLAPENTVESVNAVVLSGGSAFGLDAAAGVQAFLHEAGRGFRVGPAVVPIVPAAILFDLDNHGAKAWGRFSPYRELGWAAAAAAGTDLSLGTVGAGTGARVAGLKGGTGSASTRLEGGLTLGALVAVNAVGAVTLADGPHFWAAPFEQGSEFGGLGWPSPLPPGVDHVRTKLRDAVAGAATTIALIATDAVLTKAQAKRLAVAAHDGLARAIWPAHTPFDGDLVFALATGASGRPPRPEEWFDLSAAAASTLARAVARGVHAARSEEGEPLPCWQRRFGAR